MSQSIPDPQVIQETERWLVFNKPPGWLTIPGRNSDGVPVLSDWAKAHHGALWVTHRLDRETSGVILFAKSAKDHQQANSWFQERKTKKIYRCLASGRPSLPLMKLNAPIEGAPSTTQVEILESYVEGFLAQARPSTGRRHQIRIHLAGEGFPLWGDPLYGGKTDVPIREHYLRVPRVALHACFLELPTGERFEAPDAEDFASWLIQLRKEGQRA